MDEGLWFVEVLEEKNRYPNKAEKNGEVVCDQVV
jgi:hypothetical protein